MKARGKSSMFVDEDSDDCDSFTHSSLSDADDFFTRDRDKQNHLLKTDFIHDKITQKISHHLEHLMSISK